MDNSNSREILLGTHRFYLVGILLTALFLIFVAFTVIKNRVSTSGRASSGAAGNPIGILSRENSYTFVSPVSAKSDGKSLIRVTVFILNNQGLGLAGQKVSLRIKGGDSDITPVQPETDAFGRAIFDVSSQNPGDYTITAETGGAELPQAVKVSFHI